MINIFKEISDIKAETEIEVDQFLRGVKSGQWEDTITAVRAEKDKKKRSALKEKLPYVTISGSFDKKRAISNLKRHSGFLAIDLDNLGDSVDDVKTILSKDKFVYACFVSCSGYGLCVVFKIEPTRHHDAFASLSKYLLDNYNLIVDQSGKDVSRPRYVSFDPVMYMCSKELLFKNYLPKERPRLEVKTIYIKTDFDEMVHQLSFKDITSSYSDWLNIAFGLANHFGEGGRQYFHLLSRSNEKYNDKQCDRQYDACLRGKGSNKATIASIYWHAKQNNIQFYSEQTREVLKIARTHKLSSGSLKGTAETIRKFKPGLVTPDLDSIIEQADKLYIEDTENEIDDLLSFIKTKYNLIRNEVTMQLEDDGKVVNDSKLNSMVMEVKRIFPKATKEVIHMILFSDDIPSYHPFTQWFQDNKEIPFSNEIDEVIDCFDFDAEVEVDGVMYKLDKDYLKNYFSKWIIGIVASAHGTYSLLILVLCGKQGKNKTNFFRELLPEFFRKKYFSDTIPDEPKDEYIMMTNKLLIVDDEFEGKTKKDVKRLKRLSSVQTFNVRLPYGKGSQEMTRYAVLGGTSNEYDVINDPTGNRRIIPVNVVNFNMEKFRKINKDSLFNWAYHEFMRDKTGWFLDAKDIELLNRTTLKNTQTSSEEELINKHLVPSETVKMTCTDIVMKLQYYYPSFKTTTTKMGLMLKKCGFERKVSFVNGKTAGLYSCEMKNYEL